MEEALEQARGLARSRLWDGGAWLKLRQEVWEAGLHRVMPLLLESVDRTSQKALEDNCYVSAAGLVDLSLYRRGFPSFRWLSGKTRLAPVVGDAKPPPPLSFSTADELEAGMQLAELDGAPVFVSSEVSQFSHDGLRLDGKHGSRSPEAGLLLRTD
ncbi:unnamed protein product, partial [Polarella glacialis]